MERASAGGLVGRVNGGTAKSAKDIFQFFFASGPLRKEVTVRAQMGKARGSNGPGLSLCLEFWLN